MAKSKTQQAAIAISMKKAGKKPKMQKGGGLVISPKGTIIRATPDPGGKRYTVQKLDTTGYSKGKKSFNLVTTPYIGRKDVDPIILKNGKPIKKTTSIPRSKVEETIKSMKKGATKKTDLRSNSSAKSKKKG